MKAIFAVNSLDGFGDGTTMPWPHSKVDMQRFKATTTGKTVIMGKGTWLSDMPKPLPNRRNCVLSNTLDDHRCEVFRNVTHLMMNLSDNEETWVIGGARTLWVLRPYITEVHLTRFNSAQSADVILNTTQYLDEFSLTHRQDFGDHVFDIYTRNQ